MKPSKATVSIMSLIASGFLGVDAMVFDDTVLTPKEDIIANERVEVKQIENIVEAKAPWKGEQGITVKYDMGEPTFTDRVKDRRKQEVIYETVDFGDGGFKVDVLLTEKPNTNRFCYIIEGAENYDFFYQPPLTPEEIAEGASRPPEIEGSYAVYHKTLKNHVIGQENYATGKVMHIPRPQVWEIGNEEATKQWADLSYENGQLCVTAPQDFLDKADYTNGVRIDPTFGYTTLGATSGAALCQENGASDASQTAGQTFNLPNEGTLISIDISGKTSAGTETADAYAAIYRTDSAGVGSHDRVVEVERLEVSNTFTTTASFYTFTTTAVLSADDYIIAGLCDGADIVTGGTIISLMVDDTNDSSTYSEPTLAAGSYATRKAENPWTQTVVTGTDRRSIYATYATARPVVNTTDATNISGSSATLNGDIITTGTSTVTQHGFVWGTNALLSGGDTATTTLGTGATGTISETISINSETQYYFRAYATNSAGNAFGSIMSFLSIANPRARINNGTIKINNGTIDL